MATCLDLLEHNPNQMRPHSPGPASLNLTIQPPVNATNSGKRRGSAVTWFRLHTPGSAALAPAEESKTREGDAEGSNPEPQPDTDTAHSAFTDIGSSFDEGRYGNIGTAGPRHPRGTDWQCGHTDRRHHLREPLWKAPTGEHPACCRRHKNKPCTGSEPAFEIFGASHAHWTEHQPRKKRGNGRQRPRDKQDSCSHLLARHAGKLAASAARCGHTRLALHHGLHETYRSEAPKLRSWSVDVRPHPISMPQSQPHTIE
jgi:hypothetical protein